MSTKSLTISFLFILFQTLISCSSEDPFVICRDSEYDCDYQHLVQGIVTVTKGSSRKHYVLTEKGMKPAKINDGEPVAYNPVTGAAVIKEMTDSSVEIFALDTRNGKKISSEIVLKPEKIIRSGRSFSAFPTLLSGCVLDDGTMVLLVNYENLLIAGNSSIHYSEEAAESIDVLYVYEKGGAKKLKKYIFPQNESREEEEEYEDEDEEVTLDYFWEEPKKLQCTGKNIRLFSEKQHANEFSLLRGSEQPGWILSGIALNPEKSDPKITDAAFIAYDDIRFNYYSEKEKKLYIFTRSLEDETVKLRILGLDSGYELPEEPVEKKGGEFLFSETPDGKPLIFFVKTRSGLGEQRLEPLF